MYVYSEFDLYRPLTKVSAADLPIITDRYDVLFLLIHDRDDPVIRVCFPSVYTFRYRSCSVQDLVEEAAQPFHGSPPLFSIHAASEVLASLSLPAAQQLPVIVSLKDHSPVAHRRLIVTRSLSVGQVSDWLMMHSLPMSAELDAENFVEIMGPSPIRPGSPPRLVVLGAIDTKNMAQIDLIKQTATSWHRGEQATDSKQVVFAWMDKEKWAKWLKSVYGVQDSPGPTVVIADHGVRTLPHKSSFI